MLDLKELRSNPDFFEKKLLSKDPSVNIQEILTLDENIRSHKTQVEELKAKRNKISKEIGVRKREKKDAEDLLKEVDGIGDEVTQIDLQLKDLEKKFNDLFARLPNLPMDGIKVSLDPKDNVEIKAFGEKKVFDFPAKNHIELNETLHLFDFVRGAKISGSGFPIYTGFGARLEWALLNYMLDIHRKNGFTQIIPPILVKPEIMFGSAHLPKFEDQQFKIKDEDFQLYLVPTAEAALNGMHFDEILDEDSLPISYVSYTPCFRREAGAAGEKERGLIRTHQFNKVELFCLTKPDESEAAFEKMLQSAEEVVQGLELHYRNMLLVTSDMSFASAKTIDIEAWLPGQNRYYEVSSISNCTDFQARRSKIRYKSKTDKPKFVHTLNGSGVATSRLMVSLLETHQQEDGTVKIPKALQPYLEKQMQVLAPNGT
ncbi:MAG: serine--tRNA ligase [Chlamydiota bacterium]|jgi:seryl-tRNA synthetase